jgi:branched-chain amino acid transport system substrate-binding protein
MSWLKSGLTRRTALKGAGSSLLAAAALRGGPAWAAGEPIKIGHQCDLTSTFASTGYWRKKAADAAIKWVNDNGGIAGRPVEIITIDTESKVDVGILRLRQLIQNDKVDFVIGSQHGGIAIANNPIAQEQKTICLSMSRTDSVTGSALNAYVFRIMVNTSLAAKAAGSWLIQNTGKRWSVVYADYVWGQSNRDSWSEQVNAAGGTISQAIPIPVNTADPLTYIQKIDRSADAVFIALLGPDLPRALAAMDQLGFRTPRVTADALFGVFDILGFGSQVEGLWGMDSIAWELSDKDTPHMRMLRKAVGLDDHGREVGTNRSCTMGDVWPAWESVSFVKRNVEGSGWKTRADTDALIKYAEANPNYPESALFPQGPLFVRPEDHQAFCDYCLLRIEDKTIRVKKKVDYMAGIYPPKATLVRN